jgi:hypothetical protein
MQDTVTQQLRIQAWIEESSHHARVCQMVEQVVNRSFASGIVLRNVPDTREHGQAAVLDLLCLHLLQVALAHAHGVEKATRVAVGDWLEAISDTEERAIA